MVFSREKSKIPNTIIATPNVIGTKLHNIGKFRGVRNSPNSANTIPQPMPIGPAFPGPYNAAMIFTDGKYTETRVKPANQGLNSSQ